jgi:hypothetical protein
MADPRFELERVLLADAAEIVAARTKAHIIHHTKDVDAAGDEIEQTIRRIVRRKLPSNYYIGHGHIVDENLVCNGQHDIVIADNTASPILFSTENGTEYFPYESVYTIGEIKSTYYRNRNYLEDFTKRTTALYTQLSRQLTPTNQVTKDLRIGVSDDMLEVVFRDKRPYKNPLLKFMFFVDAGKFELEQIQELYNQTDDKYLPNLICLLNKGIVVKIKESSAREDVVDIKFFPEFIPDNEQDDFKWAVLELGEQSDPLAAHLSFFFFALNSHLQDCLLLKPNLYKYHMKLARVKRVYWI